MAPRRTKRLLLASVALTTVAGCGKKSRPPLANPKGSYYDEGLYDAAPADASLDTPDAAPAPATEE